MPFLVPAETQDVLPRHSPGTRSQQQGGTGVWTVLTTALQRWEGLGGHLEGRTAGVHEANLLL